MAWAPKCSVFKLSCYLSAGSGCWSRDANQVFTFFNSFLSVSDFWATCIFSSVMMSSSFCWVPTSRSWRHGRERKQTNKHAGSCPGLWFQLILQFVLLSKCLSCWLQAWAPTCKACGDSVASKLHCRRSNPIINHLPRGSASLIRSCLMCGTQ